LGEDKTFLFNSKIFVFVLLGALGELGGERLEVFMNKKTFDSNSYSDDVELDRIAKSIVDAAYHVHVNLGPGLLESIYETCLVHELGNRNLSFSRQAALAINYDNVVLEGGLRLDVFVENKVILEIKSVETILPIHRSQLMTYLKLANCSLGFLINFNVIRFKDGIERIAL